MYRNSATIGIAIYLVACAFTTAAAQSYTVYPLQRAQFHRFFDNEEINNALQIVNYFDPEVVDSFLDPLGWFGAIGFVERLAMKVTDTVNERSLNLELFQGFEETVIDMYSAVRHAYLERRRNLIKE